MGAFNWESFLRCWSQAILESMEASQFAQFPPEAIAAGWLGYPGATEAQIAQAERRLQLRLPPSYREFLKVSNGWRQTTPFIRRLWSTEEIERFATRHSKWIEAFIEHHETAHLSFDPEAELDEFWEAPSVSDQDYFVYGENQDCSKLRVEYLQTAIEISDVGESFVYLLNPQVETEDGEWEAWFFGDCLPGADRYRSFQELMQAEYQNFLELREAADAEALQAEDSRLLAAVDSSESSIFLAADQTGGQTADQTSGQTDRTIATASWTLTKRLIIEFQKKQVGDRTEYRTVANADLEERSKIWLGLEEQKLRQWIRQQLMAASNPPIPSVAASKTEVPPEVTHQAEPKVMGSASQNPATTHPLNLTLKINQLEIRQETRPPAHIVVSSVQLQQKRMGIASLTSQTPFSLEVAFHLMGQNVPNFTSQPVTYKAQFHAQNRMTGQWITLGETRPSVLASTTQTYMAQLFGNTLAPGIYRLQILTVLRGAIANVAAFELPFLQVM